MASCDRQWDTQCHPSHLPNLPSSLEKAYRRVSEVDGQERALTPHSWLSLLAPTSALHLARLAPNCSQGLAALKLNSSPSGGGSQIVY